MIGTRGAAPPPKPQGRRLGAIAFVVLMLALTALFTGLGMWQWQRLGEKEALIAAVASRIDESPVELPSAAEWPAMAVESFNYRPLRAFGRYVPEGTVLVFTSLGDARGRYSGPGYWVMTPLALAAGGTLFVNRGFVPESSGPAFATGGATPTGEVVLTGIGRVSEQVGSFTPAADTQRRVEWVRNIERLALFSGQSLAPYAPIYIDLPASDPGALPQGGETVVDFPNNHLGYALTWFGFALLTPIMLVFWLRRRGRAATNR